MITIPENGDWPLDDDNEPSFDELMKDYKSKKANRPARDELLNPGRYDPWVLRCGTLWRAEGNDLTRRKAFIEWCLQRSDKPDFLGDPPKAISNVIDRLMKQGKWPAPTPAETFSNFKAD